jgi:hypothetical protein
MVEDEKMVKLVWKIAEQRTKLENEINELYDQIRKNINAWDEETIKKIFLAHRTIVLAKKMAKEYTTSLGLLARHLSNLLVKTPYVREKLMRLPLKEAWAEIRAELQKYDEEIEDIANIVESVYLHSVYYTIDMIKFIFGLEKEDEKVIQNETAKITNREMGETWERRKEGKERR